LNMKSGQLNTTHQLSNIMFVQKMNFSMLPVVK
jgi:hypothetical protein